jgi:guanylate kinase
MIKEKKSGQVIVISSPSGGGKGSIIKGLLKNDNQTRWLSISTTTRKKRKSDIEGVTYNFTTKEDFENKIKQNYFLEYATYADNYYGTPKNSIKEKIDKGIDVILEIEIEGAKNIKKIIPEAIFIFIMPPSLEVLLKRLKNRNTETKETIIKRFNAAYKEINEVSKYNYVVVNDKLDIAIDKVESIIKAEKCRVDRIEEVYLDNKEEYIHELLIDKQFDNSEILK